MHIATFLASVLPVTRLQRRQTFRLRGRSGERIECRRGSVWITQDGDPRDVVLGPCEAFTLDRRGTAVVSALQDAVFVYQRKGMWTQDVAPTPCREPAAPGRPTEPAPWRPQAAATP